MSAQPVEPFPEPPRTPDDVAAALPPVQRMEFYREIGTATEETISGVLRRWRLRIRLYQNPDPGERMLREHEEGTRPGVPAAAALRAAAEARGR